MMRYFSFIVFTLLFSCNDYDKINNISYDKNILGIKEMNIDTLNTIDYGKLKYLPDTILNLNFIEHSAYYLPLFKNSNESDYYLTYGYTEIGNFKLILYSKMSSYSPPELNEFSLKGNLLIVTGDKLYNIKAFEGNQMSPKFLYLEIKDNYLLLTEMRDYGYDLMNEEGEENEMFVKYAILELEEKGKISVLDSIEGKRVYIKHQ